jgi:hypothetical protein
LKWHFSVERVGEIGELRRRSKKGGLVGEQLHFTSWRCKVRMVQPVV